ncbi:MAG: NADAR family protein [Ketobacter sp.]|nr:NADAR family protein [Ketobacter sp.]
MNKAINFYLSDGEYGCFSNFSRHPVYLKDKRWPTSEHYFQAQKFAGTEHEEQVRYADRPMKAANMGRDRKRPFRSDWEEVKDDIMRVAVMTKFTQHKELTSILLSTGDAEIVEHTANDSYWADGGDGSGLNMLGKILMEVREAIKAGKTKYENGNYI